MSRFSKALVRGIHFFRRTWWAVAYFAVCGLIPVVIVGLSYDRGLSYIQFYAPLFLFPLLYGWIAARFLQSAHREAVAHVLRAKGSHRSFWLGVAAFAAAAFALEVVSPIVAVWEAPPKLVNADLFVRDFLDGTGHSSAERSRYQEALWTYVGGVSNLAAWPISRWAYFGSIYFQALLMIASFASCAVLAFHRFSTDFVDSQQFRRSLAYVSLAISILLLWLMMRIAFEQQRVNYFLTAPNVVASYVIGGLFLVAFFFVAGCFWVWLGEHIAQAIAAVLGIGGSVVALLQPGILVVLFGKDAGLTPHITILAGIALVAWAWLILRPRVAAPP